MTGYRLHHKFKTPHSPLISHRCQKEACTEIKGRIWALCSKIKLSVVIFYITFRTAYWKMFARITATLASCLFSCPHPSFFSLSSFSSLCTCHCRFPLPVHCVAMVTVTRTRTTSIVFWQLQWSTVSNLSPNWGHSTMALTLCSREYCLFISHDPGTY